MVTLPIAAQYIIDTLAAAGFESYAVGGSIRDILIGRVTHGWDFTTNAKPEEILKVFPDSFYDNQFGTVGVKIYDLDDPMNQPVESDVVDIFEITTYRSEQGYTDHRHPDQITWGKSIEEDLSRRDFSINAIAYNGKSFVDPYNGRPDLEAKLIRAVRDPDERFAEDALRIMRAIRIASQLGFTIEENTLSAIRNHATSLSKISAERIREELFKLLSSPFPADGIMVMKNTGILQIILPELEIAFGVGQKSPERHHIYDVGTHLVEALRHCPSPDPVVRFATLLHDIGKPATVRVDEKGIVTFYNHEVVGTKIGRAIASRLRLSKKQTEKVLTLIRWHQFTVDERQTDTALRRFIRHVGKENLEDMLALRIGDRLGGGAKETSWRLELFKKRLEEVQLQPFTVADLKVNGYDVMTIFETKPGRIIGEVLDKLFLEVEEQKIPNDREPLLTKLHEYKESGEFLEKKVS